MKLRQYQSKDCGGMSELFYDTVHTVNRRDYTEEQICAWADGHVDPDVWNRSFLEHFTVIAEDNGTLDVYKRQDHGSLCADTVDHASFDQSIPVIRRRCVVCGCPGGAADRTFCHLLSIC